MCEFIFTWGGDDLSQEFIAILENSSLASEGLETRKSLVMKKGEAWKYVVLFYFIFYLLIFLASHVACGILVPQPGMEPEPHAVGARSLNHWTAREVPAILF